MILDAGERIGDPWRKRWHSLRLFTPARYDGLDGMPFPAPGDSYWPEEPARRRMRATFSAEKNCFGETVPSPMPK